MDGSFREQGSGTQQDQNIPQGFLTSLPILGNVIKWLTGFFQWTEEEWEDAGIYIDRLGDE